MSVSGNGEGQRHRDLPLPGRAVQAVATGPSGQRLRGATALELHPAVGLAEPCRKAALLHRVSLTASFRHTFKRDYVERMDRRDAQAVLPSS